MARTAPAPNIPPIPGMCPSVAVLAGGGDAGGGGGNGAGDGSGDNNAGAGSGGENAEGDGRGAPDYQKHPECGYASHPVDVVTGRAFTHPIVDLELPGPLPLAFSRMYSSKAAHLDMGIGFGWAHTFGWKIEVKRRSVVVWNEQGVAVDFPLLRQGEETIGPWGWVLRREAWGFAVDADDGLWHLFSEVDPRDASIHLLTAVEDRNRNRISLTYDDGRLVEVKDSAGRVIKVIQTREGRIGSIQVQNAISQGQWIAFATYTYDDHGNLATATDADGHSAHYEYDEDHRLTLDQDRAGLAFHFVYDHEGRCIESWGDYPGKRDPSLADGLPKYLHDGKTRAKGIHHCKFEYGDNGYTEVVDSTQVRRFFGNKHGTLDKAVEGGGVMTAVYRDDGHIIARTDPMGGRTQWERDERGRVLKVTDALGRVTVLSRDAAGLVVELVDAAGGVQRAERDAKGNVLSYVDQLGGVTSYRWDERGLLLEEVTPRGDRTLYTYDEHGNRLSTTWPNGGEWRYAYDALGRIVSETDPVGASTRYAYSARGDLIGKFDAAGGVTRNAYDGEGHLAQIVDPHGRITELTWGGYHKLCGQRDAAGQSTRLGYNLEGELVSVHNEHGEVHRIEYDATGRMVGEHTFDGRTLRYRNDAAGRPILIVNGAKEKTKLTYDLAGQLVERELDDGIVESFVYDSLGRVVEARSPSVEIAFERDALGRISRETQRLLEDEHAVESTYDANGARTRRSTSLGHVEAVARDGLGARISTTLDGTDAIAHQRDLAGREVARTLPRAGRLQSTYDRLGRLARRRALGREPTRTHARGEPDWLGPSEGAATLDRAYRYDADGEQVEIWDSRVGSTLHEYDAVGRLLSRRTDVRQAEGGREERFSYSATGDAHEAGANARAREYARGGRLVRRRDTVYTWDEDGRLTARADDGAERGWRYRWDGVGNLAEASGPDGSVVTFKYDPFARRLEKRVSKPTVPGGQPVPESHTRFVWDGEVLVHEIERRAVASGDPIIEVKTYCFEGNFRPLAHKDRGAWHHYVNDPSGAPERLLASDGTITCELSRSAWGATTEAPGATTHTPLRFAGQYADSETGLFYNRYRYYDPEAGRYVSRDPIGLNGGLNAFKYGQNPVSWIDPWGLNGTPSVPAERTILSNDTHRIVQNYGDMSREHADPIHFHVEERGRGGNWRTVTRITADGAPVDGDGPVPAGAAPLLNQQGVNRLRRCEDRITRTIRATGARPGGRPFNPGNRG